MGKTHYRPMYALFTALGTAASETALCEQCFTKTNQKKFALRAHADVVVRAGWQGPLDNEALLCNVCGAPGGAPRRHLRT